MFINTESWSYFHSNDKSRTAAGCNGLAALLVRGRFGARPLWLYTSDQNQHGRQWIVKLRSFWINVSTHLPLSCCPFVTKWLTCAKVYIFVPCYRSYDKSNRGQVFHLHCMYKNLSYCRHSAQILCSSVHYPCKWKWKFSSLINGGIKFANLSTLCPIVLKFRKGAFKGVYYTFRLWSKCSIDNLGEEF